MTVASTEQKFNCGKTGLKKTEKTDENIKAVKKMILDNCGSWQTIFTNVLATKRAALKIVPKLQNFEQKQRRMDIA